MKTVQLTDEKYYPILLAAGIIKEEEQVVEPAYNPWEKYPTLESCWEGEDRWSLDQNGRIFSGLWGAYNYSTEAEAKRARATIKLSRIARKWNEGVSLQDDRPWFVTKGLQATWCARESNYAEVLPFYFHTKELLEKSLEMFEQDWKDFYGK